MKTVHLVAVLLLGCVGALRAETTNPKVDSLKRLLLSGRPIDKAEVLWSIAYELFDVDNPQALFYSERAYHEVWPKGDSLQIVKVGTTYGQLLRRMGKLDESIEVSSMLLLVSKRHGYRKQTKMLLNSLQLAYAYLENYDKALTLSYESLAIRKEDGEKNEIVIALTNLSLLFYKMGDYEQSIAMSKEVQKLAESDGNITALLNSNLNIGSSLFELRRFQEANDCFKKAVELDRAGNQTNAAQLRQMYARTLLEIGQIDSARYYGQIAKMIASKSSDHWALISSCHALASISMAESNFEEANRQLLCADSVISIVSFPLLLRFQLLLKARYFSMIGLSKKAIALYERHNNLIDSTQDFRRESRIRELHVSFAQKENELKIKNQEVVLKLQNESIATHRKYILLVTGLVFVLGILAIKLYKAKEHQKIISRILDERVVERTKELGNQRHELQHSADEHHISNMKVSSALISSVGTLKGLLHLASIEDVGSYKVHINQAVSVVSGIDELARTLSSHGKSTSM